VLPEGIAQTALIGGNIFLHDGKPGRVLTVVGRVLALVSYVLGAESRYLVEAYRKHVAEAAGLVADRATLNGVKRSSRRNHATNTTFN